MIDEEVHHRSTVAGAPFERLRWYRHRAAARHRDPGACHRDAPARAYGHAPRVSGSAHGDEPPTLTPLPDGYPTPADAEAADPYPAGDQLLISKPLGTQCSDPATFEYANLNAAVNALIANGIRVYSARITNRMVCEACTCPTSEHFEMIVNPEDAAAAVNLGWNIEGEP